MSGYMIVAHEILLVKATACLPQRPPQIMPAILTHLSGISILAFALISVSCGPSSTRPSSFGRPQRALYGWHDDGGPGKVTIRISLSDQIAEFERDGREIGWCYVATGKEGHGTADGTYKITEKIVDKYSNRYGWIEDEFGNVTDGDARYTDKVPEGMVYVPAPMPYWMRLTSYGIGMHGGLIPEPGKPASHGCIRLPKEFVPVLFDAVEVGTPVTITHDPSNRSPLPEIQSSRGMEYTQVRPAPSVPEGRVVDSRPLMPGEIPPPRRMTDPFSAY